MFKRIRSAIKKTPKLLKLSAITLMIAAVPVAGMAYGPDRPTFDYNKLPVGGGTACTDQDVGQNNRCGSMTGPVFDSFVNAPGYGDERNFTLISDGTGDTDPVNNGYNEKLQAQVGHEYWVRMYVHNNANQGLNCNVEHRTAPDGGCTQIDAGAPGIANGVHVSLEFSKGKANGQDLKGVISGNNFQEVFDSAQLFNNDTQFRIEYVPNSTKILTAKQNTVYQNAPTDNVAETGGMLLGQTFNGSADGSGSFPGCFDFATRVYVKVVVKAPIIKVVKQAFVTGTQNMIDGQTVAPDTQITWKIHFMNIGNDVANDVTLRDTMPNGATFAPGTLKFYTNTENGTVQDSQNEDVFFHQGGINIGNYAPLTTDQLATLTDNNPSNDVDEALLTYRATINNDKNICQLVNTVFARAGGTGETSANSTVNINRNCNQTPPPSTPPAKVTAAALPNTGAGDTVGIFGGVSAAGTALYQFVVRRKVRK